MNTQRGFGHITVDGEKYPIRFSLNQTQVFCELEGCELKGFNDLFASYPSEKKDEQGNPILTNRFAEQKVSPDTLRHMIYSALKEGHRVAKKPLQLSLEDTGDLIDLMDKEAWRNVLYLIVKKEEAPSPKRNPGKPDHRGEHPEGGISWEEVRKIGYGVLCLKPTELWDLSWSEFWEMYEGWKIRQQYAHEHTRYLAAMMVNTSMGAPKQPMQPKKLYALPEIDGQPKKTSAEEIEAFRQRISKRLGREIVFQKPTTD